jgi:hypothetical protein
MKRDDFKKIIKLRSIWKIDRRKGNYTLPNGEKLTIYVKKLVESQMKIDNLLIASNGDLYFGTGGEWDSGRKEFDDFTICPPFSENEICTFDEMESRINRIVNEIVC